MLVKKRSETLLKIILDVEVSQKLLAKQLCSELSCVSNNKYGYIDVDMDILKAIYRGEPKDRNIETEKMIYEHTERWDSIRKGKVETRLK